MVTNEIHKLKGKPNFIQNKIRLIENLIIEKRMYVGILQNLEIGNPE